MACYNGPKIYINNLICYLDFMNMKSYTTGLAVNDLISSNNAILTDEVIFNNGLIVYNSSQNVNILINESDILDNFIIDIWFIKGSVTYQKFENGVYKSTDEQLLNININDYKFTINLSFEDTIQQNLNNYSGKTYNLIVKCNNNNVSYTINDSNGEMLPEFNQLTNYNSYVENNFIGKMLILKIYNTILETNEINNNFKNIKSRKWA